MSQVPPPSDAAFFITHSSQGVLQWAQSTGTSNKSTKNRGPLLDASAADCFISEDGNYLATTTKQSVRIHKRPSPGKGFSDTPAYELQLNEPKQVIFSPKSTLWAVGTSPTTADDKSLKIFNLATGKLVFETTDKKRDYIKWTADESLAYRLVGSELYFYEQNDFSKLARKVEQKIASYSLAHNRASGCTYVAVFVKGTKGAPSSVKVYSYPHLNNIITSQSLFKVDSVELKWNSKGDALLLEAIVDVDTTGKSYYGETKLHFLDLKGNACLVSLGKKEGSVHSAEWLPNNEGFIAVYGRTPAAVTLFNNKGEPVHQFGESPVNSIYLNPFGNLVAIAGFGNLSGDVHIWNLKTHTKISHFQAADTTHFSWTADGLHMITSTLYARLKVANGFKVWDYLGNLLHTEDCRNDSTLPLFKVLPVASAAFPPPEIGANTKGKILSEAPVAKYIPPFLRNKQQQQQAEKKLQALKHKLITNDKSAPLTTGPSPTEKKLRNLTSKLEQIEKLKKSQAEGKQLEKNQLEKLSKEQEIVDEIAALKLEA